jgi:hypothetical protein
VYPILVFRFPLLSKALTNPSAWCLIGRRSSPQGKGNTSKVGTCERRAYTGAVPESHTLGFFFSLENLRCTALTWLPRYRKLQFADRFVRNPILSQSPLVRASVETNRFINVCRNRVENAICLPKLRRPGGTVLRT